MPALHHAVTTRITMPRILRRLSRLARLMVFYAPCLVVYLGLIYSGYQQVYRRCFARQGLATASPKTRALVAISDLRFVCFVMAYFLLASSLGIVTSIQNCTSYDFLSRRQSCRIRYRSFHLSMFLSVVSFVTMSNLNPAKIHHIPNNSTRWLKNPIASLIFGYRPLFNCYWKGVAANLATFILVYICKIHPALTPVMACLAADIITLAVYLYYTAHHYARGREQDIGLAYLDTA